MTQKIYLQDIIPLDDLKKEGNVLLIRHSHDHLDEMNKNNLIDEYQSYQSQPAFLKCKYIVVFLGAEKNTGIFYGIFEVFGILQKNELPECTSAIKKYFNTFNPSTDFYLQLKRIEKFDKFKDRLIIDWMVPRGWYNNYGEVIDKEVRKLLPENFVRDFPGLMGVKLNFNELKKIIENPESHSDWYDSLTRLQAVYLILYGKGGAPHSQYVGTTYGEKGLWQRWESYVKTNGTGGNVELIKLKNEDPHFYNFIQFSILEVLSRTATQEYCTVKESIWKEKLGTRKGLNRN